MSSFSSSGLAVAALLCFVDSTAGAEEAIVLKAKRWLDVSAGHYVSPAAIRIEDGKITALGDDATTQEARVVDLGDITLLPGLIDLHTHLTYDHDEFSDQNRYKPRFFRDRQHAAFAPAGRALIGARNAGKTLRAGFTTVRDLGACCFADVTLARAIEAGVTEGPTVIPSAHVITTTGGACDQTIAEPTVRDPGPMHGIADGIDAIRLAVREQVLYGAGTIKTCAGGEAPVFDEPELQAMAAEAHRRGVKLAAHSHDLESSLWAVRAGADSIEHGTNLSDETISLMIERGTLLVPTISLTNPDYLDRYPEAARKFLEQMNRDARDSTKRAIQAGVAIGFGSDTGELAHGDNAQEFAALVEHGLAPIEAVRAATTRAAEFLELSDRGRIAVGLRADLIGVAGDPLAEVQALEDVSFVMRAGKIISDR